MAKSRFDVCIPGRNTDVNGNTLQHEAKVPSPTSINYIRAEGLWTKSITAFDSCLSTTVDKLETPKLAEEVRLLLNPFFLLFSPLFYPFPMCAGC